MRRSVTDIAAPIVAGKDFQPRSGGILLRRVGDARLLMPRRLDCHLGVPDLEARWRIGRPNQGASDLREKTRSQATIWRL